MRALRVQGDAVFNAAEAAERARLAELDAIADRTEMEQDEWWDRFVGVATTLYRHAILFPAGSERRIELCSASISASELDGDRLMCVGDYLLAMNIGRCYREIGRPDDAVGCFESVVKQREFYGEKDADGFWPEFPDDVAALVCEATLEKTVTLAGANRGADGVATAKDYFASMRNPWRAPSTRALACQLIATQIATGDAKGAAATTKSMIDAAPRDADALVGAADRLLALGRAMNGVDLARRSFADWTPPAQLERECWTHAAACFEAALALKPDARTAIRLGRTYGFLGRWSDAARVDAAAFAREPILTPDRRRIDPKLVTDRSDLVVGYLEWGVAERMAFRGDRDKERLLRCRDVILTPLANSLTMDTEPELYLAARYHLVRTMMDRGEFMDARLSIDDVERSVHPVTDGDFGYWALFLQAQAELHR